MPPEPAADHPSLSPSGLAIQMLDPESDYPARGITVALPFADGTEEQLVADETGLALASGTATASAVGATMHAKASAGAGMVSFAPVRSGIVRIGIDMRQLAAQPFETLHLRIVGGALVPNGAEMGRYERQP